MNTKFKLIFIITPILWHCLCYQFLLFKIPYNQPQTVLNKRKEKKRMLKLTQNNIKRNKQNLLVNQNQLKRVWAADNFESESSFVVEDCKYQDPDLWLIPASQIPIPLHSQHNLHQAGDRLANKATHTHSHMPKNKWTQTIIGYHTIKLFQIAHRHSGTIWNCTQTLFLIVLRCFFK